ncbi:SPOR domain-containing protein [uncultured Roseibium sp.]|uniref:SPOR domain-containing protein n=1 Tax=uncultured Roseibium sp. TaxID=1936171 RepID=UPI00260382B1|nr:SPOR domain-containing protein [uncultured Roseibium sp.]
MSSGRVGTTDYFAGLDDFTGDGDDAPDADEARVEPTFAPAPPNPINREPSPIRPEDSTAPIIGEIRNQFFARRQDESTFEGPAAPHAAPTPIAEQASENVSPLWPRLSEPASEAKPPSLSEPEPLIPTAHVAQPDPAKEPPAIDVPGPVAPPPRQDFGHERPVLAPTVALDLEQNLTAELEDELIGALRQSVDDDAAALPEKEVIAPVHPDPFEDITETKVAADAPEKDLPAPPQEPLNSFVRTPMDILRSREEAPTHVRTPGLVARDRVEESREPSPVYPAGQSHAYIAERNQVQDSDRTLTEVGKRPAIDENDLFAALNPEPADATAAPRQRNGEKESPAGIDALFADLDFPEREARAPVAADEDLLEPDPQEEPEASADDIDDLAWPAAASAVPKIEEDETPPPVEGYDLDAVARAMQESDPSLNGAGILPPHSDAEAQAAPLAKERSRRGLYVTLGIVGVAALGGAGFFLMDGDAVQVPSGPPPVVAGLQEPLKIYPEESQAQSGESSTKPFQDRLGQATEATPDSLQLPVSPQPVELPPAPEGTDGGTVLAPGTPKQVTTIRVKPDGTFETEGQSAPASTVQPETPAVVTAEQPVPVVSTPTETNETPRVVETTPVNTATQLAEPLVSAPEPSATPAQPQVDTQATTATPEPAAPEVPAVAAVPEQTEPAPVEAAAGSVPAISVIPRKKPAAPVQVARAPAPAAQTAPAAPQQADGPLNLNNASNSPAPATTTTSGNATGGSIPSGTNIVQVTSQRSAAAASDAYAGLQRRYPSVLGNRNAVIVSADLGDRGVFYRARIPTASRQEAISLCESLKGAGGDCFVRRQP